MNAHVLVIEDDPDIRDTLENALGAFGYDVTTACHGTEAIERTVARGQRPAIILLDLQMPVMDGKTFLSIKEDQPLLAHVPVVILTAQLAPPGTTPPCVRAILRKPAPLSVMIELIRRECRDVPLPPATLAGGTGRLPELPVAALDRHVAPDDGLPEPSELEAAAGSSAGCRPRSAK